MKSLIKVQKPIEKNKKINVFVKNKTRKKFFFSTKIVLHVISALIHSRVLSTQKGTLQVYMKGNLKHIVQIVEKFLHTQKIGRNIKDFILGSLSNI